MPFNRSSELKTAAPFSRRGAQTAKSSSPAIMRSSSGMQKQCTETKREMELEMKKETKFEDSMNRRALKVQPKRKTRVVTLGGGSRGIELKKVLEDSMNRRALKVQPRRKTRVVRLGGGRRGIELKKVLRRAQAGRKGTMIKLKKICKMIIKFLTTPPPPPKRKLGMVGDAQRRFMSTELSHSMSSFLL